MDWKNLKKKIKKEEQAYVYVILAITIVSIIDEVIVKNGHAILYVLNYDAVSLVVIQIQATVQTLSIALLALISGKSDDSYMGINHNHFMFNIRPCIFTQKKIIYGLIFLLVSNIFFHMFKLYNVVIAVFIVVCILIYISVKEIYSAVMGQSRISLNAGIESYYRSFTTESENIIRTEEALKMLCMGWKSDVQNQSTLEYEKYQEVFNCFLKKLLLSPSSDTQLLIERESSKLLNAICKSKDISDKEKSLWFLDNFYSQMWSIIASNKEDSLKLNQGIHLIGESYYELGDVTDELSIQMIEKNISLSGFVEKVSLCNIWLGYKAESNYEFKNLSDLIMRMVVKLKNTSSFNSRYWGELLEHLDVRVSVWPDTYVLRAISEMCKIKLYYAIMLMRVGQKNILKDSYFSKAVNHNNYLSTAEEIKLYLKIQCYMYYLAFYESLDCISNELKGMSESLLMETVNCFINGAEGVERFEVRFPKTVFNEFLVDEIWETLRPFEFYPRNDDAKTLVMPNVASDFVIFLSMYLSNRYYHNSILYNIVAGNNAIELYMRYFQDEHTIKRFSDFLKIIGCDKDPGVMLNDFYFILKEKIKQNQIEKASNNYSENKFWDFGYNELEKNIYDYLKEKFKPIISEDAKRINLMRIPIFKINGFSDMTLENILDGNYDTIARNLIYKLSDILIKTDAVNMVKRTSFTDDKAFFSFLNSEEVDTIIGSEFSIRPLNYANREQLSEILLSKKTILEGYTDVALFIRANSLHIDIQDLRIESHSGTMNDEKKSIIYDSNTRLYTYEVTNSIPIEFTREELLKYLHDRRRIVNVVLYISIQRDEGNIGKILRADL